MDNDNLLKFVPFSGSFDSAFWEKLSSYKLEVQMLNDDVIDVIGYFQNSHANGIPSCFSLDHTSLSREHKNERNRFACIGKLKICNSLSDFKNINKKEFIVAQGKELWELIVSGRALQQPNLLLPFQVLCYADLKKYQYYFWMSYPTLVIPASTIISTVNFNERFMSEQEADILSQYDCLISPKNVIYFMMVEDDNGKVTVHEMKDLPAIINEKKLIACFCDPCTGDSPGWPLRNLIILLQYMCCRNKRQAKDQLQVLGFRERNENGQRQIKHSLLLNVKLSEVEMFDDFVRNKFSTVGWVKSSLGKFTPSHVDLSKAMDPKKLSESAVKLNLQLMRWRIMPDLDLSLIANTRCLLLGAGTLGCNVARCLLGWGVKCITLVDNGKVSLSNPVRQSLYTFEDSRRRNTYKAIAAAEALKGIHPGVVSIGVVLNIPMPAHIVTDKEKMNMDVLQLRELIKQHDAVFLLTDSRESRWLPTLICTDMKKIVINAALGFDSLLVMRHGVKVEADVHVPPGCKRIHGSQLGCYFCSDVVAPGNSLKDRTLDQQCTVSRPGVSMQASALAVELLVSIVTHPHRGYACADVPKFLSDDEDESYGQTSPLGEIPHQIRMFLSRWQTLYPACSYFDKCTACSTKVIHEYRKRGMDFLLDVFNDTSAKFLEDLTGLTELHNEVINAEIWELSDDNDEF